jgi:hypothetical protein
MFVYGAAAQQCRRHFSSTAKATLMSNLEGLFDQTRLLIIRCSAPFQLAIGYGEGYRKQLVQYQWKLCH